MITIDLDRLSTVVGGADNTTRTTAGVKAFGAESSVTRETTISNNESCRRDVKAACDAVNTGFFGVDRAKSGQCFLEKFPACPK